MQWLLVGTFLLTAVATQAASPPDCLEGYWDMGERAAVVGFQCGAKDGQPEEGRLFFCQREALLTKGFCTGGRQSIGCRWEENAWACHEEQGELVRFDATLQRISETQMRYRAKSRFNEVDLIGTLLTDSE